MIGGITGEVGGTYNPNLGMFDGGWWYDRSGEVQWANGIVAWYKCGDGVGPDGHLMFDLEELSDMPVDRSKEQDLFAYKFDEEQWKKRKELAWLVRQVVGDITDHIQEKSFPAEYKDLENYDHETLLRRLNIVLHNLKEFTYKNWVPPAIKELKDKRRCQTPPMKPKKPRRSGEAPRRSGGPCNHAGSFE